MDKQAMLSLGLGAIVLVVLFNLILFTVDFLKFRKRKKAEEEEINQVAQMIERKMKDAWLEAKKKKNLKEKEDGKLH